MEMLTSVGNFKDSTKAPKKKPIYKGPKDSYYKGGKKTSKKSGGKGGMQSSDLVDVNISIQPAYYDGIPTQFTWPHTWDGSRSLL
jgi:hypothetical protein